MRTYEPAGARNGSSPMSTPISPSIPHEYSATAACVCGGAASAPGSEGCSNTENAPSDAAEILRTTPTPPRRATSPSPGATSTLLLATL